MYNLVKMERDAAFRLIASVVEQIECSSDVDAWEERAIFAGLLQEMRAVAKQMPADQLFREEP